MVSAEKQIKRIERGDYGVRSGVYAAVADSISMEMDAYGEYRYRYTEKLGQNAYRKLSLVDMMSDASKNEDQLAEALFSSVKGIQFDPVVGYYSFLGAGYVVEGDYREKGSSGGLTTWVLDELLRTKKVDYVIHAQAVDPAKHNGILFKYKVSDTSTGLRAGAKSKYYPLEMSEVLRQVKAKPGNYAVVGIPEFITELRLLADIDADIKKSIKYTVGLVCGHQKSAKYVEALAWQHGISPGKLKSVDFRVKQAGLAADDYLQEFTGEVDGKEVNFLKKHHELFADNWPMGFFKSNFSDYTDNAFNETADIVLGDAWLEEYNSDDAGNNIVIVRHPDLDEVIRNGTKRGALKLDEVDAEVIKQSQSGLVHHVRDELPYRLFRKKVRLQWAPRKRVAPSPVLPALRKKVQALRLSSAKASHEIYRDAISKGSYQYFEETMARYIREYDRTYEMLHVRRSNSLIGYYRIRLKLRTRLRQLRVRLKIRTRLNQLASRVRALVERIKFSKSDGAIVTLSGYYNYGNILQRYALQKFLQKNGLNFVSYWNEQSTSRPETKEQLRYTSDFVKRNITCKSFDPKDDFPVYIVGSDQVWRNWSYTDVKKDLGYYFFDFLGDRKVNRIAYAASVGQDTLEGALISEEVSSYIKPFVNKFDSVSIRESSGVDLVKREWGVDAKHVIDPTLLLSAEDYSRLIDECPYDLPEFADSIFTYFILSNESKRSFVEAIIDREGLVENSIYLEEGGVLPPVESWVKGIRDAKLVVADSFHGVVFSILFNRPFIVVESGTGGAARITSLLSRLDLDDRYITSDKAAGYDMSKLYDINWDNVNKKLDELRADSGDWLLGAIKK